MNVEEGVEKIVEITKTVESGVTKPCLSWAFIAGGMVVGGSALVCRGAVYVLGYIKDEKNYLFQKR